MRSKPLIGINTDYRSARKDSPAFSFIAAGYHDAVATAGGIPVVIPSIEGDADIERRGRARGHGAAKNQVEGGFGGHWTADPGRSCRMLHALSRICACNLGAGL